MNEDKIKALKQILGLDESFMGIELSNDMEHTFEINKQGHKEDKYLIVTEQERLDYMVDLIKESYVWSWMYTSDELSEILEMDKDEVDCFILGKFIINPDIYKFYDIDGELNRYIDGKHIVELIEKIGVEKFIINMLKKIKTDDLFRTIITIKKTEYKINDFYIYLI
jgi:hypothetical protein